MPLKNVFANEKFARIFACFFSAVSIIFSSAILANPAVPLLPPIALPSNGKIVAGSAVISQTQTATSASMTVNQISQRAVVNWDSFSVGKNATVTFNQPNASAVTLNRVTGTTASMIEGAVKANGQVIFVNPSGVTFSKGAEINAGGVVATTMDIANKDFMEGKSTYRGNSKGSVINEGKITTTTDGGYIALLAPEVRNDGYLLAKKGAGTVAMASGEQITLDFRGNSLISVKVDLATYNGLIENKRLVEVNGGLVVVAAGSANQLMASVIKNTGRISATSLVNNGGVIELVANSITQAGKISANGKGVDAQGGQVNIVGNDITIATNSTTLATGTSGGGQINIGLASTAVSGGTQVNAPTQATIKANADAAAKNQRLAKMVNIERGALVDASATQSGNGGTIAIWSEIKTTVAGILKSTGGVLSGNGGFIETSSKGQVNLAPTVSINTAANNRTGKSGSWLLDPIDLTIDSVAANVIATTLANNNVTIEVTTGSLILNGNILKQGSNATSLTLSAGGNFVLNADISGENLSVIINSSIAYLNVGTSINATQVTVQAQTIYSYGNINTRSGSSLGAAIQLLAEAIYVSGRLTATTSVVASAGQASNSSNSITLRGDRITLSSGAVMEANSDEGGQVTIAANDSIFNSAVIQANGGSGRGGTISIVAANDITFNQSAIQANGTDGGSLFVVAQAGDLIIQNATIQTNGSNGRGGSIAISGYKSTQISQSNIEARGLNQGGKILIGNDASNGTLPFSILTSLDQYTRLNTAQTDINNTVDGGFIETSGQTLNLLSSINAGRGGMWLIDPYDITINATEAGYINTALNASTNVVITTANASNSVGSNSISSASGTGNIYIKSAINATTGSATLTMTATEIQLEANVTTRGNQTYNGNLLLAQNSTLTSNNGNVTINGDIRSTGYLLTGYLSLTGAGAYNFMGTTGTVGATASMIGGGSLSYSSVTSSYTWIPGNSFTSQYLLVGAGGAGGGNNGGGGGAGAVITDLAYAVTGGSTYTIKVGVGVSSAAGGLSSITVDGVTTTATGGAAGSGGGNYGAGAGGSSGYTIINGVSSSPYTGGPY